MSAYLASGMYLAAQRQSGAGTRLAPHPRCPLQLRLFRTICACVVHTSTTIFIYVCYPPTSCADVHTIQRSIANHIEYTLASSRFDFDDHKAYLATAHRYATHAACMMPQHSGVEGACRFTQ